MIIDGRVYEITQAAIVYQLLQGQSTFIAIVPPLFPFQVRTTRPNLAA
jgi:hypothetical protein